MIPWVPGGAHICAAGEALDTFMMKNSKKAAHALENQNNEEKKPSIAAKAAKKTLHVFGKAVDLTIDLTAGVS